MIEVFGKLLHLLNGRAKLDFPLDIKGQEAETVNGAQAKADAAAAFHEGKAAPHSGHETPAGAQAKADAAAAFHESKAAPHSGHVKKETILNPGQYLDSVIESGFYTLLTGHPDSPGGAAQYSQMIVGRGLDTVTQTIFAFNGSAIWNRTADTLNQVWQPWRQIFPAPIVASGSITINADSVGTVALPTGHGRKFNPAISSDITCYPTIGEQQIGTACISGALYSSPGGYNHIRLKVFSISARTINYSVAEVL